MQLASGREAHAETVKTHFQWLDAVIDTKGLRALEPLFVLSGFHRVTMICNPPHSLSLVIISSTVVSWPSGSATHDQDDSLLHIEPVEPGLIGVTM